MREKKRQLLCALIKIVYNGIVRTRNVVEIPDRDPNDPAVFSLLSYWISTPNVPLRHPNSSNQFPFIRSIECWYALVAWNFPLMLVPIIVMQRFKMTMGLNYSQKMVKSNFIRQDIIWLQSQNMLMHR